MVLVDLLLSDKLILHKCNWISRIMAGGKKRGQ